MCMCVHAQPQLLTPVLRTAGGKRLGSSCLGAEARSSISLRTPTLLAAHLQGLGQSLPELPCLPGPGRQSFLSERLLGPTRGQASKDTMEPRAQPLNVASSGPSPTKLQHPQHSQRHPSHLRAPSNSS